VNYRGFLAELESGAVRVAAKTGNHWQVNAEVKQQILEVFRNTPVVDMPGGFRDKQPLAPQVFTEADKIRMVPGGSAVRSGAHIGANVVIMPPSYVNIGAFIDEDSMVDSHVLVGSCAQVGKRVHLAAGVQIGGVLEPVGNRPVIVEDDCFIGAGAILMEGILVRQGAVVAPGVTLSAAVPIYDVVNETIVKGEIPANAVVVPGSRQIKSSAWAQSEGLSLNCAIIVKYRDTKTNAALVLEEVLR
jgi:2,3,4,5-tetrahydropyridine-2-carboxylate N-succinyltransferase